MSIEAAVIGGAVVAGGAYYLSQKSANDAKAAQARADAESAKAVAAQVAAQVVIAQANQASNAQSQPAKTANADAAGVSALLAQLQKSSQAIPVPLPASYYGSGVPATNAPGIDYALANQAGALSQSFVQLAKATPDLISGFRGLFASQDAPTYVSPDGFVPSGIPGFSW